MRRRRTIAWRHVRRLGTTAWRTRWLRFLVGIAAVAGFLWLIVVLAPPWFVDGDSLPRRKAQNEVRTTLLQGVAGVVLLVGAYFTWRQLQTAREGQITERYTRSIDQIGHAELDVRLGGIYALERIARDSAADQNTIGEVLTAFVRTHAPWPPRLPGQFVPDAPIDKVSELQVRATDVQAGLTVLGRGGFTRSARRALERLDLTSVDLRRADLMGAHLEGADLNHAHLEKADLRIAHLEGTDLRYAHLEGANLRYANLERAAIGSAALAYPVGGGAHMEGANLLGANLRGAALGTAHLRFADLRLARLQGANLLAAHLEGAHLGSANMEEVILIGAYLERADLSRAHLERADLSGAHLENANLTGAHLEGASLGGARLLGAHLGGAHLEKADLRYAHLVEAFLQGAYLDGAKANRKTAWPAGFDWRAAGVLSDEDGAADST